MQCNAHFVDCFSAQKDYNKEKNRNSSVVPCEWFYLINLFCQPMSFFIIFPENMETLVVRVVLGREGRNAIKCSKVKKMKGPGLL